MNNAIYYKSAVIGFASLVVILLLISPRGYTESAQKLKMQEKEIREQMLTISEDLSVTCSECHNLNNFKDNSKKGFKVGLEHMKLVEILKERGMDGKRGPEATCYMCHRGKLMPDYKRPVTTL